MNKQKPERNKRLSTLDVAKIIICTTCLNIFIALSALALGLWIDDKMGWQGIATVILILTSFPVSLLSMVWLALVLIKHFSASINPKAGNTSHDKEE